MNPDILYLAGVTLLALCFPLSIRAFSTSGATMRPVMLCILAGGTLFLIATRMTPQGHSLADVPRIVARLVDHLVG